MDKHVKIVNNKKIVTLNDGREFELHNYRVYKNELIFGCLTDDDIYFLHSILKNFKNPKILEIGVLEGLSTFTMLDGSNYTADIYCVDRYVIEWSKYIFHDFIDHVYNMHVEKNIHFIWSSYLDASKVLSSNLFDIIFIDGEHDYDSVKQDISLSLPLLSDNGILCGHDYSHDENGEKLIKAVHDVLGEVDNYGLCWYKSKLGKII